eukprot:2544371-Prymnesium_polylepis.2
MFILSGSSGADGPGSLEASSASAALTPNIASDGSSSCGMGGVAMPMPFVVADAPEPTRASHGWVGGRAMRSDRMWTPSTRVATCR